MSTLVDDVISELNFERRERQKLEGTVSKLQSEMGGLRVGSFGQVPSRLSLNPETINHSIWSSRDECYKNGKTQSIKLIGESQNYFT